MSDQTTSTTDGMAGMMRLWLDMAAHATEAYQTLAGTAVSPEAMRQGQSNLYKIWGDWWDRYLRSTPFLDAQKQYAGRNVEFQKQIREQLGRLHHELQLASAEDIDQLMIGVRRIGEELREHCESIDERIAGFSAQLDALAVRLEGLEKSLVGRTTRNGDNHVGPKPDRTKGVRRRARRGPSR